MKDAGEGKKGVGLLGEGWKDVGLGEDGWRRIKGLDYGCIGLGCFRIRFG